MIETYKILSEKYDSEVTPGLLIRDTNTRTRGHSKKLKKRYSRLGVRKYAFANRIVDPWNNIPAEVVNAKTLLQFEKGLDKHWEHQEVKYDYTKDLDLRKITTGNYAESGNKKHDQADMDIEV